MANSGSFGTSAYSSRNLTFNWWVNSQDIGGNYTDIGWNLVGSGGTSTSWYQSGNFKVIIEGEQVYYSSTRIKLYNGTVVASGTKRIYHNNDGSKSFSAYAEAGIYTVAVNVSGSGSWWLPQIARYSVISSADNFNDEANPTMRFTNPSNGYFSLKAKIEAGGNAQLITRTLSNTATSCTFNLTEAERDKLRALCKNSNSLAVRFTICCMSGTTELSASFLYRTMTIVNGNPTFTKFTYKDTNTNVVNITGNNQVLVKGLSTLQATISSTNKMVAKKQASAKNYVATIDNINKSIDYNTNDINIDLGKITSSGTKRLNIRAYDTRNNSTLVYKDIIVYDYDKPVINASVTRLNNFEAQTTLKVSGTYSKLTINNVDKNVVTSIQYRYRETGGTWGSWKTLTSTIKDGKFTCNDVILSLDNTKAFEFEIKAVDKLQPNTIALPLDIGQAIFFVSSNKKACYINGQEILTYDIVDEW